MIADSAHYHLIESLDPKAKSGARAGVDKAKVLESPVDLLEAPRVPTPPIHRFGVPASSEGSMEGVRLPPISDSR